jgi:hypothetical protein
VSPNRSFSKAAKAELGLGALQAIVAVDGLDGVALHRAPACAAASRNFSSHSSRRASALSPSSTGHSSRERQRADQEVGDLRGALAAAPFPIRFQLRDRAVDRFAPVLPQLAKSTLVTRSDLRTSTAAR